MLSTSLLQSSVLCEKYHENEPEVYKEEDCHLEKKMYMYMYIYISNSRKALGEYQDSHDRKLGKYILLECGLYTSE